MRVECTHCHKKFDIAIRAVLAEAARLAEMRKAGDLRGAGVVNGNVLTPKDERAKAEREEGIKHRAGGPQAVNEDVDSNVGTSEDGPPLPKVTGKPGLEDTSE